MSLRSLLALHCIALAVFGVALLMAFAMVGIDPRLPLAGAGMRGVPHAVWFDACAFVLPGFATSLGSVQMRRWIGDAATAALRFGLALWVLSGIMCVLLGVFPVDLDDLDNGASQLHETCWMLWLICAGGGTALVAIGSRGRAKVLLVVLAMLIVVMALLLPRLLGSAIAQSFALAAWLAAPVAFPRGGGGAR